MPSQKQLRWSQLRVGLTVILASIALAILIFLMTGTTGLFTPKLILKAYFDNAQGLRVGAPVRLQGVDIGNVINIVVAPSHGLTPVEVSMKVSSKYAGGLHKDSTATLSTAGVLGETFIDIDSTKAKGPQIKNGDVLAIRESPALQDVVKATQGTLQNVDILLKRMDRILAFVESGEGSIGKLIYDPELFNRMNATLTELQKTVNAISSGQGSIGKLIVSDELYVKANGSIDKINAIIDQVESGKGTIGKFLKDPEVYNNTNQTISKANKLMDDINSGKGALGKFASDQEFARKLDNIVSNLNNLSTRLDKGEGSAGKLFSDPSLYNNADQMLVETRNMVQAIRENPKKYLTIRFRVF